MAVAGQLLMLRGDSDLWKQDHIKTYFILNVRKNLLTIRSVQQWNNLPMENVGSLSWKAFTKRLDNQFSWMT